MKSRIAFWLIAAGCVYVMVTQHAGAQFNCFLSGALTAAWLVRTPALSGDPAVTRWLVRSRIVPIAASAGAAWVLLLSGFSDSLRWDIMSFALPPLAVLAILSLIGTGTP